MSPFFCVRTSPEPYGARAGQRLPAQRLKPQGAEKEKMPVKKKLTAVCVLTAAVCLFAATAFAETGDVAGVIQSTWQSAAQQIKTVVNTVVFPALDLVPFPVSWTVKMKKKQKETQDILSYHTQAAGCSDKARAKASGGRQPIEECGRTGL